MSQTRLQSYATGHFAMRVDSSVMRLAAFGSTADLMRKFGFGRIRSYGVGGITTPSFRGSGGSHTAVLWNGISLVSPLNGQSDLSLLPVNFVDDIQMQSGGSATLYGSGAIGGTIQLNNKPKFRQGFDLSLVENQGSFRTSFHGLSAGWSRQRWISTTKLFFTGAQNDFPFVNTNFTPARREVRQHNGFRQYGLLQQNYWQIGNRGLLSARFWFQDNATEVPAPSSVTIPSQATQDDRFFRTVVSYHHDYGKGQLFVQSSHVLHRVDYEDPVAGLADISTFHTLVNTLENTQALAEHLEWTSGLNHTFESVSADELTGDQSTRNRTAVYSALRMNTARWRNVLSARQEIVDQKPAPFSPSLGLEYNVSGVLSVYGSVSRNYRIPTFNDLYWNGAGAKGNGDLRAETSWSEEAGIRIGAVLFGMRLDGQLAAFSNHVDNWILWAQRSGIWSPENVRKVWARGIETNGTAVRKFGRLELGLTARYSFTASTTQAVYDASRQGEIGNQLFFTPKHESSVSMYVEWKSLRLTAINNYTGKQYTDDSNNEYLAMRAYHLTNVWLSRDVRWKQLSGTGLIEFNNLFDRQVNARPGYPLPGFHVKAGLSIRFNKPIQ